EQQAPEGTRQRGEDAEEKEWAVIHAGASPRLDLPSSARPTTAFRKGSAWRCASTTRFQSKATWPARIKSWPSVARPMNGIVDLTTLMNGSAGLLRPVPWIMPPTLRERKTMAIPIAEDQK